MLTSILILSPGEWEQPFIELRKTTDQLFDDFFRSLRMQNSEWQSPWGFTGLIGEDWPRVYISETDGEIQIAAELPGVDKDNIDISVIDDKITIRGEKRKRSGVRES